MHEKDHAGGGVPLRDRIEDGGRRTHSLPHSAKLRGHGQSQESSFAKRRDGLTRKAALLIYFARIPGDRIVSDLSCFLNNGGLFVVQAIHARYSPFPVSIVMVS